MLTLYDLAGADPACRFSPYGWRVRMALAHKGLEAETVPVRFTEKHLLAFSGQDKVPVLRDGDRVVADSWAIATYLDQAYPDRPTLCGDEAARGLTGFARHWAERVVMPLVLPLIVADVPRRLGPEDAAYFRRSREARFGRTLEEVAGDPAAARASLKAALAPLRATLGAQPFLAGSQVGLADYAVFGAFQWARVASPRDVLDADDPVFAWRDRLLDLFGGLGRATAAPTS